MAGPVPAGGGRLGLVSEGMATGSELQSTTPAGAAFATTHWSVVLAAGKITGGDEALAKLCQSYWYPLYAYVRRQGHEAPDAQDLTQEFFARLLAKNYLADVQRERGRFRSFLLASLKHFLANEWDKARAQKRGGGQEAVPIDTQSAETRYGVDPAHDATPDRDFDRRWAMALLDQVLANLRAEFVADGKQKLFEALKVTLTGDRSSVPYGEIATQLGMSEGAVKVAVHRLRQRYREQLRAEIAHTVAASQDVEEELRHLFAALAS
jgi:RNA polymerase sigma factor (sigma-70 family)